jgi:hypothetical protein
VRACGEFAVSAADIADGYILACQAVPLTREVGITY